MNKMFTKYLAKKSKSSQISELEVISFFKGLYTPFKVTLFFIERHVRLQQNPKKLFLINHLLQVLYEVTFAYLLHNNMKKIVTISTFYARKTTISSTSLFSKG